MTKNQARNWRRTILVLLVTGGMLCIGPGCDSETPVKPKPGPGGSPETLVKPKPPPLVLAKDGKALACVLIPKFEDEKSPECGWTKNHAAAWLRDYLKRITGAEFPLVTEGEPTTGVVISVGATEFARQNGFDFSHEKWNTCTATVKNGALFLLGHDDFVPKAAYLGAKGTCKAVTLFLEKCAGVRWYMPGPMGVKVPNAPALDIPGDLALRFAPVFAYEGAWFRCDGQEHDVATYANNHVYSMRIKSYGGHSWNVWVPEDTYFPTHPEYFYMDEKGVRRSTKPVGECRNHLCTSNPEVRDILLREIRKLFDEGFDWVQLGQSDGWRPCRCEKCQALDEYWGGDECQKHGVNYQKHLREHPAERIHLLHKYIIDECAKSHPGKIVHFLAYAPTIWPSKKFDSYGDNVVAEVCHFYEETLPLWATKCSGLTVYLYEFGWYNPLGIAPARSLDQIAEQLRLFQKNKVVGLYICGYASRLGLMGPQWYARAKLLENPLADPWPYAEEFCRFIYGNAADPMIEFHRKLDARAALSLSKTATPWDADPPAISVPENAPAAAYSKLFPEETLAELEGLLAKAEAEAAGDRAKGFIRATRETFDYVKYTARMFNLYLRLRGTKPEPPATLAALRNAVDQWEAHRLKLLALKNTDKEFVDTYYRGCYEDICGYLDTESEGAIASKGGRHVGRLGGTITEPTKWPLKVLADAAESGKSMSEADDVEEIVYREDFEDAKTWPSRFTPGKSTCMDEIVDGGKSGKCLHARGIWDDNLLHHSNWIKSLKGGGRYRVTLWVKADKFQPKQDLEKFALDFNIAINSKTVPYLVKFSTPYFRALGGWQELVVDAVDFPEDMTQCMFHVLRDPGVKGVPTDLDIYLDSLRVARLKEKKL